MPCKRQLEIENPILKENEFVMYCDNEDGDRDEQFIKIGDGKTRFNDLKANSVGGNGVKIVTLTNVNGDEYESDYNINEILNDTFIFKIMRISEEYGNCTYFSLPQINTIMNPIIISSTFYDEDGIKHFIKYTYDNHFIIKKIETNNETNSSTSIMLYPDENNNLNLEFNGDLIPLTPDFFIEKFTTCLCLVINESYSSTIVSISYDETGIKCLTFGGDGSPITYNIPF